MFSRGGVGHGIGGAASLPPTDFGGDLQRAQSLLSKYKQGGVKNEKGGGVSRAATATPRNGNGRGGTVGRQTSPSARRAARRRGGSPDISISFSEDGGGSDSDVGSVSIEFDDSPPARPATGVPKKKASPAGKQHKVAKAPAKKSAVRRAASPETSISISFSEDDEKVGQQRGTASTTSRRTVPAKPNHAAAPTRRRQSASSEDISISFSEDEKESQPVKTAAPTTRRAPPARAQRTSTAKPASPGTSVSISFSEDDEKGEQQRANAASTPLRRPVTSNKPNRAAPPAQRRQSASSDDISISFSEDEKDAPPAKPTAPARKAPPARAQSAPVAKARPKSAGRRRRQSDISLSSDFSLSGSIVMDSPTDSKAPARKAAPATKPVNLGAMNATAKVQTNKAQSTKTATKMSPDSDVGSLSTSISFSNSSSAEAEKVSSTRKAKPMPARATKNVSVTPDSTSIEFSDDDVAPGGGGGVAASPMPINKAPPTAEMQEAFAATEDLYGMLGGRAAPMQYDSSGSGSEHGGADMAVELEDAAAATDALFASLVPARAPSSESVSSRGEEDAAAAATEQLYGALGHVRTSGSSDEGTGTDGGQSSGSSDRRPTLRYEPLPVEATEAADATAALHSMLATVRDGSPSSSDDDVPQSPNATRSASAAELESAAAATDALFQQLSVFQGGPEGGSQSSRSEDRASNDSGGYYKPVAPTWRVKGESQELGTSRLEDEEEDGADTGAHPSMTGDEDVVFLQHPSVLPHFPGQRAGAKGSGGSAAVAAPRAGMRDQATQIGTMNEMCCQVGFDERYRMLFDGCTLPKDSHVEFRPPSQPSVQYIPAAVPGGWVPWGAPEPAPPAAEPPAPAQPPAAQPSPEPSSVDDYSMSFEEEETTVVGFRGATIRRSTRGYSSFSQDNNNNSSFVSESIASGSPSRSRVIADSPRRASGLEPIMSGSEESVTSMADSSAHSEPPSVQQPPPARQRQQPTTSMPQTGQARPALPWSAATPPQVPAAQPASTPPPQVVMVPVYNGPATLAPRMGVPSATGTPVTVMPMGYTPSQWGTSSASGAQIVANSMSLTRPDFVPSSLEDAVAGANADELFRHQLGALSQKVARARTGHLDSVSRLSSHSAVARVPAAGSYSYTTLESTMAYIRCHRPYQDC